MTAPIADASVYTDPSGLSALKRAAHTQDPKALRETARQFESLFTRMMLKSMRDANFKDPIFGSDQQDFYQGMFDDQLAVQMSKGHGLGLADMLVQQLTRAGLASADPTNAAAKPAASATPGATAAVAPAHSTSSIGAAVPIASTQADFVRAVWPAAQAAGRALGVDPRHIVAQAALETGWGRSVPADPSGNSSFNLFGIKAGQQWSGPAVGVRTLEFEDGVAVRRTDKFRAYGSPDGSVQDYVALLRNNPRYAAALNTGSDSHAFATALQQGGYSTDPAYAQKLAAIAQNLDQMTSGLKLADARPITPTVRML